MSVGGRPYTTKSRNARSNEHQGRTCKIQLSLSARTGAPIGTAFLFLRCFLHRHLRGGEHVFDKDAISRGGIVDEHVRDSAHELAVLDDGRARHECVQVGTTVFNKKFKT